MVSAVPEADPEAVPEADPDPKADPDQMGVRPGAAPMVGESPWPRI